MLREDTSLSARTAMESQMAITMQDRDDRIIRLVLGFLNFFFNHRNVD